MQDKDILKQEAFDVHHDMECIVHEMVMEKVHEVESVKEPDDRKEPKNSASRRKRFGSATEKEETINRHRLQGKMIRFIPFPYEGREFKLA